MLMSIHNVVRLACVLLWVNSKCERPGNVKVVLTLLACALTLF